MPALCAGALKLLVDSGFWGAAAYARPTPKPVTFRAPLCANALTVRALHVKLLALIGVTLSKEGVFWCADANCRMG